MGQLLSLKQCHELLHVAQSVLWEASALSRGSSRARRYMTPQKRRTVNTRLRNWALCCDAGDWKVRFQTSTSRDIWCRYPNSLKSESIRSFIFSARSIHCAVLASCWLCFRLAELISPVVPWLTHRITVILQMDWSFVFFVTSSHHFWSSGNIVAVEQWQFLLLLCHLEFVEVILPGVVDVLFCSYKL